MNFNLHKGATYFVLLLLIVVAVFNVFIDEDSPHRIIAIILQAVILGISFVYYIVSYVKIATTLTHNLLSLFLLMLFVYGVLSPNVSQLPILFYGLVFFYLAYFLSYKGFLKLNHINQFTIILFFLTAYSTYLGVLDRAENLGVFFRKADNVGYTALSLMLLLILDLRKAWNVILLMLSYLLVLISFKRGAMLAGTVVLMVSIWPILTGKLPVSRTTNHVLIFFSFVGFFVLFYFSFLYWDVITYRFVSDQTGGSGRDLFWSEILKGWINASSINQIFGFGFFKVPDYLGESLYGEAVYAHSDWYELLFDHGVLGLMIYFFFVLNLIWHRRIVYIYSKEYYYAYLCLVAAWLMKSYYSGMYLDKGSIFYMLSLGFILSSAYKRKHFKRKLDSNLEITV